MAISGVSSSSAALIAGGRHELRAQVVGRAMADAGVADPHIAQGLAAVEHAAKSLSGAAAVKLRHDLVGSLLDVLA